MTECFLDQSIIVGYASFIFNEPETIIKTIEKFGKICVEFIEKNRKDFIACFYIVEKDLPKFKIRRKIILEEIRKKLRNPGYEIGSSEEAIKTLYKTDINKANKIFSLLTIISEKELVNLLIKIESVFSIRLDYILKSVISKIVIPVESIDKKLVSILNEFIDNYSDCNVFSSCLQYTTETSRPRIITDIIKVIFVTLDKEHFNENNITFIKQDLRLKSWKFPEVGILI